MAGLVRPIVAHLDHLQMGVVLWAGGPPDLAESRLPNMQYRTGIRILLFSTRFPRGAASARRRG